MSDDYTFWHMLKDVIFIVISETGAPQLVSDEVVVRQATNDEQVIALWLQGRSPHTQKAYSKEIRNFIHTMNKSFIIHLCGLYQEKRLVYRQ